MRKPPGLGRTYHHGTFHRVVRCCTGAEEERYLDLTLLLSTYLSLDEPPNQRYPRTGRARESQRARETKWALGEVVAEKQQPECEPLLLFFYQVSQQ